MKVKLPSGVSDYRTLVEENYIYVDKTKYIEMIEQYKRHVFFLRPRRFGKTLFLSVLEHYYGINHKEDFDKLFGHTYIGQNPTGQQNKYYILRCESTGFRTRTEEELIESFRNSLLVSISTFCAEYKLDINYRKDTMPADILDEFLAQFQVRIEKKLFMR